MADPCTRRQALQGAGVALLSLGVFGPRLAIAEEGEAEADGALRARARRHGDSTRRSSHARAGCWRGPGRLRGAFTTFYGTAGPPFRELADDALDRLAPLTGMSSEAGYAALKDMTLDPTRQLHVADGLTLANLTFERGRAARGRLLPGDGVNS